jgi:predicted Zn finger-like uncharacterized protein
MNNACPECGAIYAVAEKDIGRRIACKKCNTALVVAEEGLRRDSEAAPPKADDADRDRARDDDDRGRRRERDDEDRGERRGEDDRGRRRGRDDDDGRDRDRERKVRTGPGVGEVLISKLKSVGDVATWLYAIGLFFAIYGFFGKKIDDANLDYRKGEMQQAATEDAQDDRITRSKNDNKPSEGDIKDREKRKKDFENTEGPRLKERVDFGEANKLKGSWWNTMFQLIGFFLLAFGSIGFLKAENPPLKRILGGVTIFLILLNVIGGGAGLQMNLRGG